MTNRTVSLAGRVYTIEKVRQLACQDMDAVQIADTLGAKINTVRTHLSTLRRRGAIGFYDGRTMSSPSVPQPHMLLRLPCELRDLIDIEAKDRSVSPVKIAEAIIAKVMQNQELIEYVLGEEDAS